MQNVDAQTKQHFSQLASDWWDKNGPMATLHHINPVRLRYVQQFVTLNAKTVCDIGCGGGILAESMARAGAKVTAIDIDESLITAGRKHAALTKLEIDYQARDVAELVDEQQQFDVVTCMELLEHVPDPAIMVANCASLVKNYGWLFMSTINRNLRAYLEVILGAEYLLRIIPQGTHQYNAFIAPAELSQLLRNNNANIMDVSGFNYNPLSKKASLSNKPDVNYLIAAQITRLDK